MPWWTKEDLTTKVLSDRKWKEDGENGVYGYHFWSKLLFLDNVAIVKDSAAARALALTCHEGMACLYKDDMSADEQAGGQDNRPMPKQAPPKPAPAPAPAAAKPVAQPVPRKQAAEEDEGNE